MAVSRDGPFERISPVASNRDQANSFLVGEGGEATNSSLVDEGGEATFRLRIIDGGGFTVGTILIATKSGRHLVAVACSAGQLFSDKTKQIESDSVAAD